MEKKNFSHLSFAELRDFAVSRGPENESVPFMRGGIGMMLSAGPDIAELIRTGTPYVMEEPRIAVLRRGTVRVMVNMIERQARENTLVFISKGAVMQPLAFSPDFELSGMMMSNERFGHAMSGQALPDFAGNSTCTAIEVGQKESLAAFRMFELIWDLLHGDSPADGAVNGLIRSLVCFFDDMNKRNETLSGDSRPHAQRMFERFISLVNAHCREERSIGFYAGKMCVSPRYLGTVVKNASGITAKEWLDRATATAAKVMLRHTDKQTAEIADALHFSNAAFFCKFFRRMTGQSPQGYRMGKDGNQPAF